MVEVDLGKSMYRCVAAMMTPEYLANTLQDSETFRVILTGTTISSSFFNTAVRTFGNTGL